MKNADKPAFPFDKCDCELCHNIIIELGLTKREEFARSAMQGILANPEMLNDSVVETDTKFKMLDELRKKSYQVADAMLEEPDNA